MEPTYIIITSIILPSVIATITTLAIEYFKIRFFQEGRRKKTLLKVIKAKLVSDFEVLKITSRSFPGKSAFRAEVLQVTNCAWWESIDFEIAYYFPKSYIYSARYVGLLAAAQQLATINGGNITIKRIELILPLLESAIKAFDQES